MAKEYDITKSNGTCDSCGRQLDAGDSFVAVLHDRGSELQRQDYCAACWQAWKDQMQEAFSSWHGQVRLPAEPKRTFVPDDALIEVFEKLDGHAEPAKVNLRFVLALMLMRKRLLRYDSSRKDEEGREVWAMRLRSSADPVQVVHPHLDDEQLAEVAAQLGAVFEEPT